MSYRTIILPFTVYGDLSRKLLYTASMWRAGVEHVLRLTKEMGMDMFRKPLRRFKTELYKEAYRFIPNKYYAESCCELVYEIGSAFLALEEFWRKSFGRKLPVAFEEIRLSDWIMFESRGDKYAKGNPNIRLLDIEHVAVKIFWNGSNDVAELRVGAPRSRRYREILEEVIELASQRKLAYNARVYIRDASEDVVRGEIQVAVPYDIYAKHYPKLFEEGYVPSHVLGFDVNFDRINAVLINRSTRIVYMERIDITPFVTQGRRWKDLRTFVALKLHNLFNYIAERYGAFIVAVEDPDVLGFLKLRWVVLGKRLSEDYNYKVARFSSSLADLVLDVAVKLGIRIARIDPRGTTHSEEHDEVMKRYGLDKHMASAYIVAKKAVKT